MSKRARLTANLCWILPVCILLLFFLGLVQETAGGTVIISVPAVSFTVQNARGEKIISEGGELSGNMRILDAEYFPGTPARIDITVQGSKWFLYEGADSGSDFYVTGESCFAGARGDNIRKIKVSSGGKVWLYGENMEYKATVSYKRLGQEKRTFPASGFAASDISLWGTKDGVRKEELP